MRTKQDKDWLLTAKTCLYTWVRVEEVGVGPLLVGHSAEALDVTGPAADPLPPPPPSFLFWPKLQVGEVRLASVDVTVGARLLADPAFESGPIGSATPAAAEAADPGVKLGSSSGFFSPGPFHGLPGSNSGMPKESAAEAPSPPAPPPGLVVSGQPPLESEFRLHLLRMQ